MAAMVIGSQNLKSAMRIGNRIGQPQAELKHRHNAKDHVPVYLSASRS